VFLISPYICSYFEYSEVEGFNNENENISIRQLSNDINSPRKLSSSSVFLISISLYICSYFEYSKDEDFNNENENISIRHLRTDNSSPRKSSSSFVFLIRSYHVSVLISSTLKLRILLMKIRIY
jgi:hypothetical protein